MFSPWVNGRVNKKLQSCANAWEQNDCNKKFREKEERFRKHKKQENLKANSKSRFFV